MLAAGLDGIEKKMDPPSPVEEDLYHVDSGRTGMDILPADLGMAIDALAEDEVMQEALGPHVYERYIEAKRLEWSDYRAFVTKWELDRYLAMY